MKDNNGRTKNSKFRQIRTVAAVNFKRATPVAYVLSGICAIAMIADIVIDKITGNTGNSSLAPYCMLYLVCVLSPVLISCVNYGKFINIGVNKKTFFYACALNYAVYAAVISFIATVERFTADTLLGNGYNVYGIIDAFGWDGNFAAAYFSQFGFLLLVQTVVHTLAFMQNNAYGWAADILIVVIISVFTPVRALRQAEIFFFNLVLFLPNVWTRTGICVLLSAAVYATNLIYLKKRR